MAVYNEILTGRYNRFLQKLFGIKGPPPSPQLASEIQPGFQVFTGVENRYLETWGLFGFAQTQAAVAGQFSTCRLRNPVGSNVIIVVTKITVSEAAADTPLMAQGPATTDLTTIAGSSGAQDFRTTINSTGIVSRGGLAAHALGFQWQGQLTASQASQDIVLFEDQEIPVGPGWAIDVAGNTVNQAVQVAMFWRERFLEESERS